MNDFVQDMGRELGINSPKTTPKTSLARIQMSREGDPSGSSVRRLVVDHGDVFSKADSGVKTEVKREVNWRRRVWGKYSPRFVWSLLVALEFQNGLDNLS